MVDFATVYRFLTGPFLWLTLFIFAAGSTYKLFKMISLVNKKEKFIYTHISLRYSLRSIFHWIIPFASHNWRRHPVITVVTFLFHFGILILPFFLSAHVILINKAWGIRWWTLPNEFADAVTLIVIISCFIFLLRRMVVREVRFLTTPSDYVILAIACAPFLTGFFAFHQIGNYHLWLSMHILTGELMLMAIPFTRLSHMLFGLFTRAYSGSEFGKIRHARDW